MDAVNWIGWSGWLVAAASLLWNVYKWIKEKEERHKEKGDDRKIRTFSEAVASLGVAEGYLVEKRGVVAETMWRRMMESDNLFREAMLLDSICTWNEVEEILRGAGPGKMQALLDPYTSDEGWTDKMNKLSPETSDNTLLFSSDKLYQIYQSYRTICGRAGTLIYFGGKGDVRDWRNDKIVREASERSGIDTQIWKEALDAPFGGLRMLLGELQDTFRSEAKRFIHGEFEFESGVRRRSREFEQMVVRAQQGVYSSQKVVKRKEG